MYRGRTWIFWKVTATVFAAARRLPLPFASTMRTFWMAAIQNVRILLAHRKPKRRAANSVLFFPPPPPRQTQAKFPHVSLQLDWIPMSPFHLTFAPTSYPNE